MQRRGVSLLEVLFSIGVISVGLLGIIAVVPVALHRMGQGNVADRAVRVGQNSLAEFAARGFADDNKWVVYATISNQKNLYTVAQAKSNIPAAKYLSFAIDPIFLAKHGYVAASAAPTPQPNQFPYDSRTTGARMERVSIMSGIKVGPMNWLEAESTFRLQDELLFDIDADKSLPPSPQGWKQTPQVLSGRRVYEGLFSWIATVTPELDATGDVRDTYLLSIIVMHRRDQLLAMDTINERVVNVQEFHNSGYGGGDVTLRAATVDELDLHFGDWLMLMGTQTAPSGSTTLSSIPVFRWYQVVGVDTSPNDISGNQTLFEIDVTLAGSDWPTPSLTAQTAAGGPTATQAALFKNIVGVYERSIRLQPASIWVP